MSEELSEQRLIEKYIQDFALEDCLDEILNGVVTERPDNPYTAICLFERFVHRESCSRDKRWGI